MSGCHPDQGYKCVVCNVFHPCDDQCKFDYLYKLIVPILGRLDALELYKKVGVELPSIGELNKIMRDEVNKHSQVLFNPPNEVAQYWFDQATEYKEKLDKLKKICLERGLLICL